MQVTGASRILLFYTELPDKVKECNPNKQRTSCMSLTEFPREITSAAIQIIIEKEEQDRKARLELSAENEALELKKDMKKFEQELKKDMKKFEQKLNKIMNALRIKDD